MSNQGKWDKAIRAEAEKLTELAGTFFTPDSMVAAFESALHTRIVPLLRLSELQDQLLACYRLQRRAPGVLLDEMKKCRKKVDEWQTK